MGEAKRRNLYRQQQSFELAKQQLNRLKRSEAAKRGAETRRLNEQKKQAYSDLALAEEANYAWL